MINSDSADSHESSTLGSSPAKISVIVVGAGIGGLATAIECSRKGHSVQVFESSPVLSAAGDQITLGLSARRFLKHWPLMAAEMNDAATKNDWMTLLEHDGEVVLEPVPFSKVGRSGSPHGKAPNGGVPGGPPPGEAPMQTHLRQKLHEVFYRQIQRLNLPIHFGKQALSYTEDLSAGTAIVHFADGTSASADLVIAADGINSKSQQLVHGQTMRGKSSGQTLYRSAFPLEIAMQDPLVKEHFTLANGTDPILHAFMGASTHAIVLTRPDKICWALNYRESDSGNTAQENWHAPITPATVLDTLSKTPGWNAAFKALVALTPDDAIFAWPLIFRNPQSTWHSPGARVLQLGDAAHTFLPTSGNGATQAIEDAVTIATCLAACGGDAANVPLAVRAHNTLRFERVECTQLLGFANAEHMQKTDFDAIRRDSSKALQRAPRFVWQHDPEAYAERMYDGVVELIQAGRETEWVSTNTPAGYVREQWTIESVKRDGAKLSGDWS